jgi:hypothetical protein
MNRILAPVFALAALTMLVLFRTGFVRIRAIRQKRVPIQYFKLLQGFEPPPDILAPARNFANLFEMPVLFYLACLMIWTGRLTDDHYVGLAWIYFALRLAHTVITLTVNKLRWRFGVFLLSNLPLIAIWVRLAIAIF